MLIRLHFYSNSQLILTLKRDLPRDLDHVDNLPHSLRLVASRFYTYIIFEAPFRDCFDAL
jgi:hypothetical protein